MVLTYPLGSGGWHEAARFHPVARQRSGVVVGGVWAAGYDSPLSPLFSPEFALDTLCGL
jgi:hypothetical protein